MCLAIGATVLRFVIYTALIAMVEHHNKSSNEARIGLRRKQVNVRPARLVCAFWFAWLVLYVADK